MRYSSALVVLALPLIVAACGKLGALDTPPGSIYPKIYPANAVAPTQPASPVSDAPLPAFTKSGAWIDPDTRQPRIDSRADQDNWSAINKPGTN